MIQRREFLRDGAATAGLVCTAAFGQGAWLEKPVRIVVLFPAGGASDVLTRMLAEKLQARFNLTFVSALVMPAATPAAITGRLSRAVHEIAAESAEGVLPQRRRAHRLGHAAGDCRLRRSRTHQVEAVCLSGTRLD